MSTTSFFRHWFDRDEEQLAQSGMAMVSLHTQIAELSATVSVLLKMLGEAGQVDMKVLRYRVEAELDARHAPSEPEDPATMPAEITCAKCAKRVPPQQTIMTAFGAMCDPSCKPS